MEQAYPEFARKEPLTIEYIEDGDTVLPEATTRIIPVPPVTLAPRQEQEVFKIDDDGHEFTLYLAGHGLHLSEILAGKLMTKEEIMARPGVNESESGARPPAGFA